MCVLTPSFIFNIFKKKLKQCEGETGKVKTNTEKKTTQPSTRTNKREKRMCIFLGLSSAIDDGYVVNETLYSGDRMKENENKSTKSIIHESTHHRSSGTFSSDIVASVVAATTIIFHFLFLFFVLFVILSRMHFFFLVLR